MDKFLKYFLIGVIVFLLMFFLVMPIMIGNAFGNFDKTYSVSDLKKEYYSNEEAIQGVINYYNTIRPPNYMVDIEFKDDSLLSRLIIAKRDSSQVFYQKWDTPISDVNSDELKKYLGWTVNDVKILKKKLDNANCISFRDGEPIKLGFKRSGLGMFSFNIFQDIATDRSEYNDGCEYILIDRKLSLQYGGGAIGPQCFPDKN